MARFNFRKVSATKTHRWKGQHRFEHWYRDNTVYFITSRCRDKFPAFQDEKAKEIFWDRFDFYTSKYEFEPWVTTLLDNHYHTIGYLRVGENLGPLMQKLHGSVAKLVNDLLPERRVPFWRRAGNQDYFDGCIRNPDQARRAYNYTVRQAVRAGIVRDWRKYAHTRIKVDLPSALEKADQLNVYLKDLPYDRYDVKPRNRLHHD